MNPRSSFRIAEGAVLLPLLLCGCSFRQPGRAHLTEVTNEVRSFTRSVAEGVTKRGPSAWQDYFENSPSFFMAVDGRLQFADGAAAQAAVPDLNRTIKKIELQWGDALRIDPLSQDLAVVAAPWHEIINLADGNRMDISGYFTAVAENRNGRWQFRNAHWSTTQSSGIVK